MTKRLIMLLCLVVMLLSSAGAASAEMADPCSITITGYAIPDAYGTLPNGHTWFHQTAEGGAVVSIDGESLPGPFTFQFEEWGAFDWDRLSGKNNGSVTIFDASGTVLVQLEFGGKFDMASVWGKWQAKNPQNPSLKGHGEYAGDAAEPYAPFSVTFAGQLKD